MTGEGKGALLVGRRRGPRGRSAGWQPAPPAAVLLAGRGLWERRQLACAFAGARPSGRLGAGGVGGELVLQLGGQTLGFGKSQVLHDREEVWRWRQFDLGIAANLVGFAVIRFD